MKYNELFSREGLSMERLRALVLIDEAGSIAGAAPENRNQQSQFSRQLNELEHYFNTRLKRTEGRIVKLTPAGRELAQIVREKFQLLLDFRRAGNDKPPEVQLGAGDSLHQWHVLPKFAQLERLKPSAVWHTRTVSNLHMSRLLDEGELDFALMRTECVKGKKLEGKVVGHLTYSLVIPTKVCPRSPGMELREALGRLPLAVQNDTTQFQQGLNQAVAKRSWKLNIRLNSESFPQVAQAVTSGAVAGVLPDLAARTFSTLSFWAISLAELNELSREISLAWNRVHLDKHDWMHPLCSSLAKALHFEANDRGDVGRR